MQNFPDLASSCSNDVSQGDQKPVMTVVYHCYLERHGSIKQADYCSSNSKLQYTAPCYMEGRARQACGCEPVELQLQ